MGMVEHLASGIFPYNQGSSTASAQNGSATACAHCYHDCNDCTLVNTK
jgi:hypothetical protein